MTAEAGGGPRHATALSPLLEGRRLNLDAAGEHGLARGDLAPLRAQGSERTSHSNYSSSIYDTGGGLETLLAESLAGDDDWSVHGGSTVRMRNRSYSESFVMGAVNTTKLDRPIGWTALCFITYFNVCGGPWGSEEIISSVGPLPGLIGVAVFAIGWGLPMVLITSELSSAYPDDGGYSIWVAEAFGPFWGFQEAYWSWLSGVIDTAIYPVLAFDTAVRILDLPTADDGRLGFAEAYTAKLAMAMLFALPNLCATNLFGRWMTALAAFVLLPFIVQVAYTLAVRFEDADFGTLLETRANATWGDWANLISVLYWNFSGFDAVSTCAGEVRNPGRDFPRGLLLALLLIVATYVFPLTAFTAINLPDWHGWEEGSFSEIAKVQVGQWMALWVVASSFAANTGMYTAEVFEDSWQLCGMARTGLMPPIFGKRWNGDTGAPYVAIAFALFVICCLIALDFDAIVVITNLFSCLSALLELLAFLKLRMVEPHLSRPFKIPVENISALVAWLLFPFLLGMFIVLSSLLSSLLSVIINVFALFAGLGLYMYMHHRGHIKYSSRYAGASAAEQSPILS